jgi:hypothetical protein
MKLGINVHLLSSFSLLNRLQEHNGSQEYLQQADQKHKDIVNWLTDTLVPTSYNVSSDPEKKKRNWTSRIKTIFPSWDVEMLFNF